MDSNSVEPLRIIFPKDFGSIEQGNPMRGTAEPRGEVFISNVPYDGFRQTAKVDEDGNWSEDFSALGPHKVSLFQRVDGQNHEGPSEFNFNVVSALPAPRILQPLQHADSGPTGAFIVDVGLYNDAQEAVIEVGYEGGSVIVSKNMEPGTTMHQWYALLDEPLSVGCYFVKARYKLNGVWSKWTEDRLFSVGMPK